VAEAPVEAVVFDYGGVISSPLFRGIDRFEAEMGYPPGSVFELMFGEVHYPGVEGIALTRGVDNTPRADEDVVVRHDFHLLEVGEMSLAEYMSRLVERAPSVLGRPIDFAAYQRFTAEMPMGVHWPVVHRIRELRDVGLRLALLTNNIKEFGDSWRGMFPVDDLFEVIVDSSAVGLRKPDPRIYRLTCERVGVTPDVAVFVDDNPDNVAAAAAVGMEVVQFGADPWASLGVLDDILARRGVRVAR
jgi:putative hydrolase of the HAD superfamily